MPAKLTSDYALKWRGLYYKFFKIEYCGKISLKHYKICFHLYCVFRVTLKEKSLFSEKNRASARNFSRAEYNIIYRLKKYLSRGAKTLAK